MKLVILTYGTEGDTRPLAALGHALRRAGHEIRLLGDARTLGAAQALGLTTQPLAGDIHGLTTSRALAELTNANTASWMRQTMEIADGSDAILTSGLAGFVGLSVAERLGIPAIGTGMIPLTPSREFPSPFLPQAWVPEWLNAASTRMTNQLVWLAMRKALNRARRRVLGISRRKTLWTKHPMLYGISPTLLPQPADWPSQALICGQWMLPTRDFTPPDSLADFLASGPAPLYVGFGSMTGIDMPRMVGALTRALEGRRAVLWPGWNGIHGAKLPANVLCIEATPHDWLFPRICAVLHHGGSGTSHSATRAGKPSIVMPFAGDQPFWAERLRRVGVAPPALSAKRPDAAALAAALEFVGKESVVAQARELGSRMAREEGLAAAVAAVSRIMGQSSMKGVSRADSRRA